VKLKMTEMDNKKPQGRKVFAVSHTNNFRNF